MEKISHSCGKKSHIVSYFHPKQCSLFMLFSTYFSTILIVFSFMESRGGLFGSCKKELTSYASGARNLPAINCNKGKNPTGFLKGDNEKNPLLPMTV